MKWNTCNHLVTAADELIRKGTELVVTSRLVGPSAKKIMTVKFDRILKAAEQIKADSDVLVVIGIDGSYLGAKAAIDFLNHHTLQTCKQKKERKAPQITAGNSISSTYFGLVEYVFR